MYTSSTSLHGVGWLLSPEIIVLGNAVHSLRVIQLLVVMIFLGLAGLKERALAVRKTLISPVICAVVDSARRNAVWPRLAVGILWKVVSRSEQLLFVAVQCRILLGIRVRVADVWPKIMRVPRIDCAITIDENASKLIHFCGVHRASIAGKRKVLASLIIDIRFHVRQRLSLLLILYFALSLCVWVCGEHRALRRDNRLGVARGLREDTQEH
mmetsp:Transcript_23253/g.37375  ORF Transcript_23253/g.37375 Transcript_23253/m.37375 type:complete len:212 (-) Transcript_23253:103-738(-)